MCSVLFSWVETHACSTVIIFCYAHSKIECLATDFNVLLATDDHRFFPNHIDINIFSVLFWKHSQKKTVAETEMKTKAKILKEKDIGYTIRFSVVHTYAQSFGSEAQLNGKWH